MTQSLGVASQHAHANSCVRFQKENDCCCKVLESRSHACLGLSVFCNVQHIDLTM